ncbi:hypothetical protein BB561_001485 [Smittium simulii]|uniref:Myb-like domain-containing protein n=1 Tax=Smittium simulii TaxID=133385 RepID=A0A2T9YUI1_9FUNG|nr:hypothetical protein BB561_001485 [Smittium simulii]
MAVLAQNPKNGCEFFKIIYNDSPQVNSAISSTGKAGLGNWRLDIAKSLEFKNLLKSNLEASKELNLDSRTASDNEQEDRFIKLGEETSSIVKDLIAQSESIERVTKTSIFEEEITEREMAIIKQRVSLQQRQFAEFEKREFAVKSQKILNIYEHLSKEEIETSLSLAKNNEEQAIIKLSDPAFMQQIRKIIAERHDSSTVFTNNMSEDQKYQYEELVKKRTKTQKKTTTEEVKRKYHTVGRLPLDKALEQLRQHASVNGDGSTKVKSSDLESAMKGWSLARIKAYKAIKTKPNTYYYRFNAPGEVQRVGAWSDHEKKLFHTRLAEIGANGQWGIFSMSIPGRVGYQCSNYYRYLIENNKIKDPNYVLDSKGKAHYLFATKRKNADGSVIKEFRSHNKRPKGNSKKRQYSEATEDSEVLFETDEESEIEAIANMNKRTKRSSRSYGYFDGTDSDDEIRANDVELTSDEELDFSADNISSNRSTNTYLKSVRSKQSLYASDSGRSESETTSDYINPNNPLPDFLDPITLEKVTKPAISRYGHVMNYDSWIRCLMFPNEGSQKNICPLTKKPLTKRELVILTFDNIEEYRSKITYNSVPQDKLFHKLEYSGIGGKLPQDIKGLYHAPSLAVKINNEVSDAVDYKRGVLSVPGLKDKMHGLLFAGDAVILSVSAEKLQKSFYVLTEWRKRWDLNVNNKKCGIMKINCLSDTKFKIQNQLIRRYMACYSILKRNEISTKFNVIVIKAIIQAVVKYGGKLFGMSTTRCKPMHQVVDAATRTLAKCGKSAAMVRFRQGLSLTGLNKKTVVTRTRAFGKWASLITWISDIIKCLYTH